MPTPILQALILAEHVYEDKSTGKRVIAGTFNSLQCRPRGPAPSEEPPAGGGEPPESPRPLPVQEVGSPYAFVSLTDVRGEARLELHYVDLSDHSVLMQAGFTVRCSDPLDTVEVVIPLPKFPVPHPGVYALELVSNGECLGSRRIKAVAVPPS